MTGHIFINVIKHIQKFSHCSIETPIWILMDNHESHCTVEIIEYCRKHGIRLLSFPPHTSHKFQPLDVAVYGSFKGNLKTVFNDWMLCNPGRQISIYDIPALANKAYLSSFTPKKILKAFETPGIWPVNRMALSDNDFLSNYVTDRPLDGGTISVPLDAESIMESLEASINLLSDVSQVPSTSATPSANSNPATPFTSTAVIPITPEAVKPFPKASKRKQTTRNRQGKSRIYTTTPEKNRIENIARGRSERKATHVKKKLNLDLKQTEETPSSHCKNDVKMKRAMQVKAKSKLNLQQHKNSSSESESDVEMSLSDSVGDISDEEFSELEADDDVSVHDYVIVKFATKKHVRYFAGEILTVESENEVEVKFLRRNSYGDNKFVFPTVEDTSAVMRSDIIFKLPKPLINKDTARQDSYFYFSTLPHIKIE